MAVAEDFGSMLAANFQAAGFDPESDAPVITEAPDTTNAPSGDDPSALIDKFTQPHSEPSEPAKPPAQTSAAPTETTPPAAPTPQVMDYLRDKYGADFSKKYANDEAFLQGVLNANKRLSERDDDAVLGKMVYQQPDKVVDWLKQQRPDLFPQPKLDAPEPTKTAKTPEFTAQQTSSLDPEWLQYIERGRIAQDAPADVKRGLTQWWNEQQVARTPLGQKYAAMEAELAGIKAAIANQQAPQPTQDVDAKLAAFRQQAMAEDFVRANADKMFNVDANGVRTWKPDYHAWYSALQEGHQNGMGFDAAFRYAETARENFNLKRQPAAPATSPATNELARRTPNPSRPNPEQTVDLIREGEDLKTSLYRQFGIKP